MSPMERKELDKITKRLIEETKANLARLATIDFDFPEDDWRRIRGMNRQIEAVENGYRLTVEMRRP